MGNGQSELIYSVPASKEKRPGETEVFRNPLSKDELTSTPDQNITNLQELLTQSSKKYAENNCLGSRNPDNYNCYEFKSYKTCTAIAQDFGRGLEVLGLCPTIKEYNDMSIRFLGLYSKNTDRYVLADWGCIFFGITSVSMYDTLGPKTLSFILKNTSMTTVCTSVHSVSNILEEADSGKLKNIIILEDLVAAEDLPSEKIQELKDKCKQRDFNLYDFSGIVAAGQGKPDIPLASLFPDSIYTFSYTSGSLGVPKAAMITHLNILSSVSCVPFSDFGISEKDVHLSYLPLAHIFERFCLFAALACGASIGFYSGDVAKLKHDLTDLKPTFFPSVPRLFNKFQELINYKLSELDGVKKYVADKAVEVKLQNLRSGAYYTHKLYDTMIFNRIRDFLGGRVKLMLTASAPISEKTIDFLKIACCCPVLEGYGQTESGGASFVTRINDPASGHVGGPTTNTEFKLIDVPEMGYKVTDLDENGEHAPRGEILLRGPGIFRGYYKEVNLTNEVLDKDGWLHTGDIGKLNKNGSIKIINRKKNMFKLAQGEYISPEKLELTYSACDSIQEILVTGDSLQSHPVAFVYPKKAWIEEFAKKKEFNDNWESLLLRKEVVDAVLEDMKNKAKEEKLNAIEMVRKIKLLSMSLAALGLLTNTFKIKRFEANRIFENDIKQLYNTDYD